MLRCVSCSRRAFQQPAENMPPGFALRVERAAVTERFFWLRHILDHWRRPDGARIGISASAVDERSLRSLIWTIKAVIYCRCYKKKPAFNETPVCQLSVWQVNMQYIFSSVSDNQKCCKKNLAQQISGCLSLIDWLIDWCNAALQILISSDAESWAEIKIVLTFMLLVQTI